MDFVYPVENCIYAVIAAFFIGVIICPVLIPILHKMKYGQTTALRATLKKQERLQWAV